MARNNYIIFTIYFLISFIYTGIDGKTVNIEVDSEDLLNIFKSFINSDNIVKKFANHVYQRSAGSSKTYNNPFHPEDEVTSFFDETFLRKIINFSPIKSKNGGKKIEAETLEDKRNFVIKF